MPQERLDHLPIDITFLKLSEWLVDRKKLPADWRKKLLPIRNRIAPALLQALPLDVDPSLTPLTPHSIDFLGAKRIRNILTDAKPESRTLFGRFSGVAGDWDMIVRAYEKDALYLGEASQIMVQNVNYEIPYLKKQIAKLQQQLTDLERKEIEYKRNSAAAAFKYQQTCEELGIQGNNVRTELLFSTKTLPAIFMEIIEVLCRISIGQALDYYQAFVSHLHTQEGVEPDSILPILRDLREKPPFNGLECEVDDTGLEACAVSLGERSNEPGRTEEDLSISNLDTSTDEQMICDIDWDISSMDPSKKCTDHGTERMISSNNYDQASQSDVLRVKENNPKSQQMDAGNISWDIEDASQVEDDQSGIIWDIDIEHDSEVILDAFSGTMEVDDSTSMLKGSELKKDILGPLMEIEYRNLLLNDLFEIRSFLTQRKEELRRDDMPSLENQVQALIPPSLQQYSTDSLIAMLADITKAISLLTEKKTRQLIMIMTSKSFLDRLEASLRQKKQQEMKFTQFLKDLEQKRSELRIMLTTLWPKQEAALMKVREVKELCEKTISTFYDGRQVNIIGEINSVLAQS